MVDNKELEKAKKELGTILDGKDHWDRLEARGNDLEAEYLKKQQPPKK